MKIISSEVYNESIKLFKNSATYRMFRFSGEIQVTLEKNNEISTVRFSTSEYNNTLEAYGEIELELESNDDYSNYDELQNAFTEEEEDEIYIRAEKEAKNAYIRLLRETLEFCGKLLLTSDNEQLQIAIEDLYSATR